MCTPFCADGKSIYHTQWCKGIFGNQHRLAASGRPITTFGSHHKYQMLVIKFNAHGYSNNQATQHAQCLRPEFFSSFCRQ